MGPGVLGADGPEASVGDDGPDEIQDHEPYGEVGVVSAGLLVVPERPQQFETLIDHADLSYGAAVL